MDGEGGSRKRARITSDATLPAQQQSSTMASTTPTHSPPLRRPCHHETNLVTLNKDVADMRSLVTCKICVKLLYEPYSLACGHTYCYSCLSNWITQAQRATCPDCRSGIKQEPVPSYLIREMTMVFLNRRELLPDGETTEEHAQWAKEEAEIVAKDKADTDPRTGGLFKGRFLGGIARALVPIHDASDAVDRCPQCLHEVEDGWCNQCQIPMGEDERDWGFGPEIVSDDSISDDDSELDDDLEAEDHAENERAFYMGEESEMEYDDDEGLAEQLFGGGRPWRNRGRFDGLPSDEDDDEDEDDTNLDGFIVNDDEEGGRTGQSEITIEPESDSEDSEPHAPRQHRRRVARVVVDEEDDDEDSDGEDEDDDDVVSGAQDRSSRVDGQMAGGGSFGRKRNTIVRSRARPIAIDSEDEDSSEEDEDNAPIDLIARRDADPGYGTTLNYEQDRLAEYGHGDQGFDSESEVDEDIFEGEDAGYNFDPYNNYNAGAAFSSEGGSEDDDEEDEEETSVDLNNASSYWPEEDEDEDEDGEDSSSTVG